MHDSHYHDISQVNGAARDGHSHSPRELGAAEEHTLDMHLREYRDLAHTVSQLQGRARDSEFGQRIANLEQKKIAQDRRIAALEASVVEWGQHHQDLQQAVLTLIGQVDQLTEALEQALLRGRI